MAAFTGRMQLLQPEDSSLALRQEISSSIRAILTSKKMTKLEGRCECKRVSFEIQQEIKYFSHCHCSQCRRSHGAAFASFIEVKRSCFEYSSGEDSIKSYTSSKYGQRIFCQNCGSNIMFIDDKDPDSYYVAMGSINGDPELPLTHHIHVHSKAPWHEITDDLKQHDQDPFQNE